MPIGGELDQYARASPAIYREISDNASVGALPVDPRDFPDPFVLNLSGTFYAFATNAGTTNVQLMSSTDLVHWQSEPDALPNLPGWAAAGFTWAPTVLPWGDGYVLYYTVRERASGRQAISAAHSSVPLGPYVDDSSVPLIAQLALGGSIDASPFVDTDGTAYLVWKADANAIHQRPSLWIQGLGADGLALNGQPSQLLSFDAGWETPLIEAPSVVFAAGTYFLFYSANWWNTDRYAIGYATATRLLGPYTKVTTNGPWFASDRNVAGPGGQEWFTDSTGTWRMAYHGWEPSAVGYPRGARSLRLASVTFAGGVPVAS
jgi:beta-xylosidase